MEKEIAKEVMLEEIIVKAVQIPGVKVNRRQFLSEQFYKHSNLNEILDKGPIESLIDKKEILDLSKKLILTRTSQSSIASFISGIPGGLAMAATIPADLLQFFGMSLRLAQELSYLYGANDLWNNGELDDDKVKNQLILYCGVMFGVSGAVSGVRVLSTQVSKTCIKKIPQKALTKTFWYPILKKICNFVGIKLTKTTLAKGVSKVVPVVGGIVSGGINFASMIPMANKLNDVLYKVTFEYSNEEFDKDIEIIMNTDENIETKESVFSKISNKTNSIKNLVTNKKTDPYEELKKLKELLDNDIITKEEFDLKKKELLNLK